MTNPEIGYVESDQRRPELPIDELYLIIEELVPDKDLQEIYKWLLENNSEDIFPPKRPSEEDLEDFTEMHEELYINPYLEKTKKRIKETDEGFIIVAKGCMYSSKSAYLMEVYKYACTKGCNVHTLVPSDMEESSIFARNGNKCKADNLNQIFSREFKKGDIVIIDEISFFDNQKSLNKRLKELRNMGVKIICSGLDTNARGEQLELPEADYTFTFKSFTKRDRNDIQKKQEPDGTHTRRFFYAGEIPYFGEVWLLDLALPVKIPRNKSGKIEYTTAIARQVPNALISEYLIAQDYDTYQVISALRNLRSQFAKTEDSFFKKVLSLE